MSAATGAIWHDVECGGYDGRPRRSGRSWRTAADGPVLELGCGTGRVALHLAAARARGDRRSTRDPELLDALESARGRGRPGDRAMCADARDFELGREFGLVLAPMQLLQLLGGSRRAARAACACVAAHLRAGRPRRRRDRRRHAAAAAATAPRRRFPTCARSTAGSTRACRSTPVVDGERDRRPPAAPDGLARRRAERGARTRSGSTRSTPRRSRREAAEAGLRPGGRRRDPAHRRHVGSTVVLLERSA